MPKKLIPVTVTYTFPVHADSPQEAEKLARAIFHEELFQEVQEFGEFTAGRTIVNHEKLPDGYHDSTPWGHEGGKTCKQILDEQLEEENEGKNE